MRPMIVAHDLGFTLFSMRPDQKTFILGLVVCPQHIILVAIVKIWRLQLQTRTNLGTKFHMYHGLSNLAEGQPWELVPYLAYVVPCLHWCM